MNRRGFRPTGIEALEDRLALTAFAIPFAIVSVQPASEVNPKFLILTKNTEGQINSAITGDFNRFIHSATGAEAAFEKGIAKPNANTAKLTAQLTSKINQALDRLTSDLNNVAKKVPFGGQNLAPVLDARIEGSAGVTDTTTKVNTPSLQAQFQTDFAAGTNTSVESGAVLSTEALVRSDVGDYINLGVTNGDFKLGKGATLPPLS